MPDNHHHFFHFGFNYEIFWLCRNVHERESHQNHENRNLYEGLTPQGLSEARRAGVFLYLVTDPPRGRPFGGGGIHRT